MRLADEYDAAQDRGEVRQNGDRTYSSPEKVGPAELNIPPKEIHEARLPCHADLADEYDAAQDRGEVATQGGDRVSKLPDEKFAPDEIGLTHKEIHEARQIRDADRADEYDDAQDRGEVATSGQRPSVVGDNVSTAADIGLRRDQIHEARQIRDADRAEPGIAARTNVRKPPPSHARFAYRWPFSGIFAPTLR